MKSDIQIARETPLKRIKDVAENIGIPREEVISFGRHMAKVPAGLVNPEKIKQATLFWSPQSRPQRPALEKQLFPSDWYSD